MSFCSKNAEVDVTVKYKTYTSDEVVMGDRKKLAIENLFYLDLLFFLSMVNGHTGARAQSLFTACHGLLTLFSALEGRQDVS